MASAPATNSLLAMDKTMPLITRAKPAQPMKPRMATMSMKRWSGGMLVGKTALRAKSR